jgi:hypothetical protein
MEEIQDAIDRVFVPNAQWGFWFREDWDVLPFVGDISDQPFYRAIVQQTSTSETADWIVASFIFDESRINELCSIAPPQDCDAFYAELETRNVFNVDNILVADQGGKWGIISYNSDCFIVGAPRNDVETLIHHLGGVEVLKKQFAAEMQMYDPSHFREGAILRILPYLWNYSSGNPCNAHNVGRQ